MNTPSKRDPTMKKRRNNADQLEALIEKDGFKTWDFVIYRCTYQNNSDWERFMARFLSPVRAYLGFYNGLDHLDTFTPTVLEDPSFAGATVATLREDFSQWIKSSKKDEQVVREDYPARSGRYRFFVMVDQEAMYSVLNDPEEYDTFKSGFVRIVHAEWNSEVRDVSEDEDDITDDEESLEWCTELTWVG